MENQNSSNAQITEEMLKGLTKASSDQSKGRVSLRALAISWHGVGITPEHIISPEGPNKALSKSDVKTYAKIKASIIASFPKAAQEMLSVDAKALRNHIEYAKAPFTAKCKAHRKYWQQQIGAVMGDFKAILTKVCNDLNGPAGAGASKSNKKDVVMNVLNKLVKKDIEVLIKLKEKQDLDQCKFNKHQFTSYVHKAIAELNKFAIKK